MLILSHVGDLPTWDAPNLQSLLVDLRRANPALTVEWDLGAGEGWCRIWELDDVVALVRAPTTASSATRFVFIHQLHPKAASLNTLFRDHQAEVVQVDDFDAEELSIDRDDLAVFAGGNVVPDHVFNLALFAAYDLVFVTE